MAKIAGTESMANSTSVLSTSSSTRNSGVTARLLSTTVKKRWA
jgi:hypothetical protein